MKDFQKQNDGVYFCGVDLGSGESQSSFVVIKNGNLLYHTKKLWKAKIYIWWKSLFGKVVVIKEEN